MVCGFVDRKQSRRRRNGSRLRSAIRSDFLNWGSNHGYRIIIVIEAMIEFGQCQRANIDNPSTEWFEWGCQVARKCDQSRQVVLRSLRALATSSLAAQMCHSLWTSHCRADSYHDEQRKASTGQNDPGVHLSSW